MFEERNTAHVPEQFGICYGYDHLGLCHLPLPVHRRKVGNPVRIFNVYPGISDGTVFIFLAESVRFRTAIVRTDVAAVCTVVVQVHRSVARVVPAAVIQIGDGLQYIETELVVRMSVVLAGRQAVRQVGVCFREDPVGICSRAEHRIQCSSGAFRMLTEEGISETQVIAGGQQQHGCKSRDYR